MFFSRRPIPDFDWEWILRHLEIDLAFENRRLVGDARCNSLLVFVGRHRRRLKRDEVAVLLLVRLRLRQDLGEVLR